MKAHFSRVMQSFDPHESYEDNGRGTVNNMLFEKYNNSSDGRIRIDYMVHAEYTCNEEMVRRYAADCKAHHALFHTHISETKKEHDECLEKYRKTPVRWFYDLGAFENPSYLAHCVWVNEDDLDIMKNNGVTCVHNPSSNMKLGSGFAPIPRMLRMGINVALGTDGAASNNNLNMFEEMHLASVIHNGFHLDSTIMKASDVLKMATINGAKALGRPDTGSLEIGKKADIIALDMSRPHLYPDHDTTALIVYSAQGSDVCMTMVDGKILYENGKFLTIDAEDVRRQVEESVIRLF
jgi:5-methylthioadenosine/S-adenosylhomocysteine deaminase